MILYLVRHGESVFNAEQRIQGQTDIPLSDFGRQQSLALADHLSTFPIEAVYSSPLSRALETARPVAEALGLAVQTDDRLKEIHAGIFQGRLWSEIETIAPVEAKRWLAQDADFIIPGGESRRALMQRGREALDAIREAGHRQAVVVAHGGLLSAALKSVLGIPADLNPFSLYNASISRLVWDHRIKLMTLNEVQHLRVLELALESRTGDL